MQGGSSRPLTVLFLLLVLSSVGVEAQRNAAHYLKEEHHEALELFDKEKYAAAQAAFDRVIEEHGANQLIGIAARYYSARCAMKLYNRDAEKKMKRFVERYPDSPWLNEAYYQLGRYHYQKHRHDKTIASFSKVDTGDLSEDRRYEVTFKKGHSAFEEGRIEEASQAFYSIKDQEHAYKGPANYYYAHIAYRRKNYRTALEHFQRIQDHPQFKGIVPYYLTQIHYLLENFGTVIEMAPPFLDSAGTERPKEIARIIGEAYYEKERYEEAIPYLQRYIDGAYGINREDRYQMGFAQMKAGNGEKALEQFEKVVDKEDSLAQIAYYHMGELQLEKGEKRRAQNAYRSAYRIEKNERIREDALFNFAKLAYELSYDPFDRAIGALKTYIEEYPDSERREEALEYLSQLYISSQDRDAALASMERIEDKNPRIRTAYQLVAYEKGVSYYLEDRFPRAIDLFKKSRIYEMDRKLTAKSYYWEAQSYAELNRSEQAIRTFESFRREPGAFGLSWYDRSYYDAGYVLFRDSAYSEAATEFRKFTDAADPQRRPEEVADAHQRTGDSYYMIKDYERALRFYRKAGAIERGRARDRSIYQAAVCHGLIRDLEEKRKSLERLLEEMPGSSFRSQALLELGRVSVKQGKKGKALKSFQKLIDERPESFEAHKARLQTGLLLYQKGEDEKAISVLKEVVENDAGYELAEEAMNRIRDIHVETGSMDEFNEYASNVEGFQADPEEMDEANYRSAENLFTKEKYEQATEAFKDYLDRFDAPRYGINARFYRAQSLLRSGDSAKALEGYSEVIERRPNRFGLPALEKASGLAKALDRCEAALPFYKGLEEASNSGTQTLQALLGQMRCYDELSKDSAAARKAEEVLGLSETSGQERVEALMIRGRHLQDKERFGQARSIFKTVIDTTSGPAKGEARYRIAETEFAEGKYDSTEQSIYDLVHQKPSYKEWVAKGFLLLAETYRKKGDRFQAKETLKSLIDSYDGKEIVKEAEEKLQAIRKEEKEAEKEARKDSTEEELRIEPDTLKDR